MPHFWVYLGLSRDLIRLRFDYPPRADAADAPSICQMSEHLQEGLVGIGLMRGRARCERRLFTPSAVRRSAPDSARSSTRDWASGGGWRRRRGTTTRSRQGVLDLSETFPGPFLGTTRSRRGSSWRRCESSTALCQSSLLPTAAALWLLDSAGRCCWTCPLLAAETTCGLQRRLAGRRCGAGLGGSGWPWTEQRGRGSATLRTRAALSAGAAWRGRGGDLAEIAPRLRRDCVLAELWPRSGEGRD